MSRTELGRRVGQSRQTVTHVIDGRRGLSGAEALEWEKALLAWEDEQGRASSELVGLLSMEVFRASLSLPYGMEADGVVDAAGRAYADMWRKTREGECWLARMRRSGLRRPERWFEDGEYTPDSVTEAQMKKLVAHLPPEQVKALVGDVEEGDESVDDLVQKEGW